MSISKMISKKMADINRTLDWITELVLLMRPAQYVLAKAWNREYDLGDQRAAKLYTEQAADEHNDGISRVLERVTVSDNAFGLAFAARGRNIVLLITSSMFERACRAKLRGRRARSRQ
jgi:hypothetical protein